MVYRGGFNSNRPHARRFALTIHAEKPGLYHGEVASIPIELRVWPFELPATDELNITFGWYYGPPADLVMRDLGRVTARQLHTTEFSESFGPLFSEVLRQFSVWAKPLPRTLPRTGIPR